MPDFMNYVYALVSINVEDYIARGFEQLSVSFGCTGGQHRSVFIANEINKRLKKAGFSARESHRDLNH